jgi:hypothetical protein
MRREKKRLEAQEKYFRQRERLREKRQRKHSSWGVIQPDSLHDAAAVVQGDAGDCGRQSFLVEPEGMKANGQRQC